MGANGRHATDDLVPRYARKLCAGPFGAHLVQVGMADATKRDIDLHIMGGRRAALDLHRFKGFVARVGAVGLYKHGNILDRFVVRHCFFSSAAGTSAFLCNPCLILCVVVTLRGQTLVAFAGNLPVH
jgi:hypothetical protein